MSNAAPRAEALLFGSNEEEHLVAVELGGGSASGDVMVLFFRDGDRVTRREEAFVPFIVTTEEALADCPVEHQVDRLKGSQRLNVRALFASWKDFLGARKWIASATQRSASAPDAPYYALNDPVQQHLLTTGRTLFRGMRFEEVRRMQIDIECRTAEGYEFCNAERESDRIIAIAVGLPQGGETILSGKDLSEKEILEQLVALVAAHDPDVIEGHNIFNFDLPYIVTRARRHRVRLALGRNGKPPVHRSSRMGMGDRVLSYERFDIFGRHIVDTYYLAQAYDLTYRALSSFGLKDIAVHFGLAAADRTYVEGGAISAEFAREPERVLRYVRDDVRETRAVAELLSRSWFTQTQVLPLSYQNVCVRGNASKIDALMVRAYLQKQESLPLPDTARPFAGGYTDLFVEGVVRNVHHCDVRSLYPSLMLTRRIAPQSDHLGVFLKLVDVLKAYRLEAKRRMREAADVQDRNREDARQATFKILINSFYGYLGFSQGRFSDFSAAEQVTAAGRELLKAMIDWLRARGAQPVEIDTDGIYFVPPPEASDRELQALRQDFADWLPEGIEIEFDGEYEAMYSYKMKNYALLTGDGELIIKGAALKSRGLEQFLRTFLEEVLRRKLKGRTDELPALKASYEEKIREHRFPVEKLAKTETLKDSPRVYEAKRSKGKAARRASYELALAANREYRAGDQVSYYVTGVKKSVPVHENSKLVSDWDHDENVAYYLDKLDAMYRKFAAAPAQGELQF